MIITCTNCGIERHVKQSEEKKLRKPYHCIRCFGQTRSRKVEIICKECGDRALVKLSHAKKVKTPYYCLKCKNKGERHPLWKGGKILLSCKGCGSKKEIKRNRLWHYKRSNGDYYCQDCAMKNKPSGADNPAWKGGISFVPYPINWKEQLREAIRERDGHICQLCGTNEIDLDYRLPVHHIDYNKENLDPQNLISLCRNCHAETNFNREQWIMKFNQDRIEA